MKKYILLYFLFLFVSASAQIQFTRTDFGVDGDKVIYAIDTPTILAYNFGATGTNHTWRFNTKTSYPRRYDSTVFINATSNPNAPDITTNLLQRSYGNGDQYLEVSDSFVKTTFEFPKVNVTGVKIQTLNLPLTYQSQFVDSTTTIAKGLLSDFGLDPIPPFDSIRINAKVKMTSICDGWGTLILPDTTSYNALRVNQLINVEADVYLHSIIGWTYVTHQSQNTGNYSWYAPNSKSYLANVQLDSSGNFTSFTYKVKKAPVVKVPGKLLSISPDTIMQGDTIQVIVKGSKTSFTIGSPDIYTYSCDILNAQVIDDTTLIATVTCPMSSSLGTNHFRVWTPTDGYLYLYNSFTTVTSPNAPRLVAMGPNFGSMGQSVSALVIGQNTHFTKGLSVNIFPDSVTTGGVYLQSFNIINDTAFQCTLRVDDIGTYITFSLSTYNVVDGNLYLRGAFKVTHTGLQDIHSQGEIVIYPNPATTELFVRIPSQETKVLIQFFDITGKEVKRIQSSSTETRIDISELTDRFYLCKITGDTFNTTRKIFIEP